MLSRFSAESKQKLHPITLITSILHAFKWKCGPKHTEGIYIFFSCLGIQVWDLKFHLQKTHGRKNKARIIKAYTEQERCEMCKYINMYCVTYFVLGYVRAGDGKLVEKDKRKR